MKYCNLIAPILLSVSLCACSTPETASVVRPITVQNITPTNIAKNEPTTIQQKDTPVADLGTVTEPQAEKSTTSKSKDNASSNSAVKDVIIDGNGNLVVSHANGTFSSFSPLPGPAGPMGPKGDKGDRGADGEKGEAGRGIDHCQVDENNHLIVYYTDNTSQDAGAISFQIPTQELQDYEKVGYKLISSSSFTPITQHHVYNQTISLPECSFDTEITSVNLELVSINNNNPSNKYVYEMSFDYRIYNIIDDDNDGIVVTGFTYNVTVDSSATLSTDVYFHNADEHEGHHTKTFYSPFPYVNITTS